MLYLSDCFCTHTGFSSFVVTHLQLTLPASTDSFQHELLQMSLLLILEWNLLCIYLVESLPKFSASTGIDKQILARYRIKLSCERGKHCACLSQTC